VKAFDDMALMFTLAYAPVLLADKCSPSPQSCPVDCIALHMLSFDVVESAQRDAEPGSETKFDVPAVRSESGSGVGESIALKDA
jgi:hypothetical protein